MQVDKIHYVHIREQDAAGQYINNSGITFAWKTEDDGRLVAGKPAVCHQPDTFVKAEGRRIALDNLDSKDAYLVIPSQYLRLLALSQAILSMNFSVLTPKARFRLFNFMADEIENGAAEVMTTYWYESLIRARFHNEQGHLRYSLEEAESFERAQMLQADEIVNQTEDAAKIVVAV